MRLDDVSPISSSKSATGNSLKTASGTDFFLKLLLAGSLGKIWSLLVELQILENMNLFTLKIPGSWNYFAEELENFTSFAFLGIEEFIDDIIYVPE